MKGEVDNSWLRYCLVVLGILGGVLLPGCEAKKEEAPSKPAYEESYESGPLKVVVSLDKDEVTTAELLTFQIVVELKLSGDDLRAIKTPDVKDEIGGFTVVGRDSGDALKAKDLVRASWTYELEPFLEGDYVIPSMTIFEMMGDELDEEGAQVVTDEIKVAVTSVLDADAAERDDLEINEIETPVALPKPKPTWLWPTIGGVAAVLIAIMVMILWPRKGSGPPATPPTPAHEIALFSLDKLMREDLPAKGEFKLFYQRISDILRTYIENRFGLQAPDQTTEEFLQALRSGVGLGQSHRPLLEHFLRRCDLVKFAAHQPSNDDVEETSGSCRSFVMETKEGAEA